MNRYIKLSAFLCGMAIAPVFAQEIQVPSLRSLALDKASEALHSELVKPQSNAQRKIILEYWKDKAGILFNKPQGVSELYNPTIIERFEQKYATQFRKIAENNTDQIIAIISDYTKCCIKNNKPTSFALADITNGKILQEFIGHTDYVNDIALTRDNSKAISASSDLTLKVWDLKTGICLQTLQGHTACINHAAATSNNTKAISASSDHTLKVWDLKTGTCLHTLHEHTNYVTFVTITPDNTKAISASSDLTLKVWDLDTLTCLHTLQGHTAFINHVSVASDNTKAISASSDHTLKVWDLITGTCARTFQGHTDWVTSAGLSPDNTKAISASWDNTLKVWDLYTGDCLQTIHVDCVQKIIAQNNGFTMGKDIYRLEDHQSIINRMPQPKPGYTIGNPTCLIDGVTAGAKAGFIKMQAMKNKKIAMGLAPQSFAEKGLDAANLCYQK